MILPKAVSSVVVQQSGEDFFLLDTLGGEMFEINSTAARIFSLCQTGVTYEAAVKSLATELNVTGQDSVILEDVRETVKQFQELGLCEA